MLSRESNAGRSRAPLRSPWRQDGSRDVVRKSAVRPHRRANACLFALWRDGEATLAASRRCRNRSHVARPAGLQRQCRPARPVTRWMRLVDLEAKTSGKRVWTCSAPLPKPASPPTPFRSEPLRQWRQQPPSRARPLLKIKLGAMGCRAHRRVRKPLRFRAHCRRQRAWTPDNLEQNLRIARKPASPGRTAAAAGQTSPGAHPQADCRLRRRKRA